MFSLRSRSGPVVAFPVIFVSAAGFFISFGELGHMIGGRASIRAISIVVIGVAKPILAPVLTSVRIR